MSSMIRGLEHPTQFFFKALFLLNLPVVVGHENWCHCWWARLTRKLLGCSSLSSSIFSSIPSRPVLTMSSSCVTHTNLTEVVIIENLEAKYKIHLALDPILKHYISIIITYYFLLGSRLRVLFRVDKRNSEPRGSSGRIAGVPCTGLTICCWRNSSMYLNTMGAIRIGNSDVESIENMKPVTCGGNFDINI